MSYLLGRLQPLPFDRPVVLSMNPLREPDRSLTLAEFDYDHPVFDHAALEARSAVHALQGRDRLWFAGAWNGYGFHEDGLNSALAVAHAFGIRPPWAAASASPVHEPAHQAADGRVPALAGGDADA